jgi:hypothetical protein
MLRTLLLALTLALAQAPTPPAPAAKPEVAPVLAEVDRLKVVNALQAIDLASLRLQVAAAELQRVRADADALITRVSVPGWQLNDKLEFVRPAKKDGGGQ